jgi:hypothetical protein
MAVSLQPPARESLQPFSRRKSQAAARSLTIAKAGLLGSLRVAAGFPSGPLGWRAPENQSCS